MDPIAKILTNSEIAGMEMAEIVYGPNVREALHSHEKACFYLALHGECTEFLNGRAQEYRRFSVGFLPANYSHSLHYQEGGFRWFRVKIHEALIERWDSAGGLPPVYSRAGQLTELFIRLYREYCSPDAVSPIVVEGLLLEMLAVISRYGKAGYRKPPHWLAQAREFLEEHFREQLNLVAVAEAVDIHPVHLAREFRRYFNCTVGEYIRNRRVEYACKQLAESNLSLAEIAHMAGFCDQSHLSRIFKRTVGTTPAIFRRENASCHKAGGSDWIPTTYCQDANLRDVRSYSELPNRTFERYHSS